MLKDMKDKEMKPGFVFMDIGTGCIFYIEQISGIQLSVREIGYRDELTDLIVLFKPTHSIAANQLHTFTCRYAHKIYRIIAVSLEQLNALVLNQELPE